MTKSIQPASAPLSLGHINKLLKAYSACTDETGRPSDSYRPGGRRGLDMRHSTRVLLTGFILTLTMAGCASTPPERVLSTKVPTYAALPNGHNPMDPNQVSPMYVSTASGAEENVARTLERKHGHALNMLSLSGGGQNGAFGAGFLIGWRESGQRPEFDFVGGVSTGSLLATHALLGTPADDVILQQMYTEVTDKDIYEDRPLFDLLSSDSLRDTAPLRALIAKYITAETLQRVAAAFDENRLIMVGTTNVDYGQTWVWNLSLIAKDGKLDLYRKVLLASASFPIVFPTVEIDGHLFVDGAARSNVVVIGMAGVEQPAPPLYGPGNLYLISNGKFQHPPAALRKALGDVAATTVGVMMDQSMQTALTRSYLGAQFLGYNFNMVAIPDEVEIGNDPLAFDPKQMRAAFNAGHALANESDPWRHKPPNTGDIPPWAMDMIDDAM
jgi:Patatin-like phospholipase